MKLLMSTAFHLQMDGATKRANYSIAQVLQTLVCNDQKDWDEHCSIAEFVLNSSVSSTMGYSPFKLCSGHIPQLGQCLSTDTQFTGVKQFAQQVLWNLMMAHNSIIKHHVMQAHHANRHRKLSENFSLGDLVYLSTKNLSLPKGGAKKLLPKFIGPYKIVEAHTAASIVTLDLPPELMAWRVHPMFHMSLIWAHIPNDDGRFPCHDTKAYYDFGTAKESE